MLSEKMVNALNDQVNAEFYSSYLYLSMSSWFKSINLMGFARWMEVQAMEEMTHALKFFNYIMDRGQRALTAPLAGPPTQWESPLAVFEEAYNHELKVSGLINNLVDLAISERDHATNNMLQWFVTEQVEEEASADAVVQKLRLMGDAKSALYLLDQELGRRFFTPPPGTTILSGAPAA